VGEQPAGPFVSVRLEPFFFANGILLFTVICFPFATGLIGQYLGTPYGREASGVYAAVCLASNIGFNLMWWAAARDWTNFRSEATHTVIWQIRRNALVGTGAYILAVASAFVSAFLCIAICTVLWIVWAATLVYFKGKLTK